MAPARRLPAERGDAPGAVDVDRRLAEAFQAPEGVWNRDADRIRLDVFALGALAYYVLAGHPAAADRAALRERLHRDDGLDLAADLPQVPSAVRALVLEATRPAVSERLPDVRSFLERLADAERALAGPAEDVVDPLEAAPGAVIDGRFRLERRLGAGSTAVGLLVTDLTVADSGPDATRVLKVAVDDAAAARIADEAEVLAGLTDPRLVRLVEGPLEVGGRQALVLESAGEQTLGEVLRGRERLSLDLLERWGTDLLEALVALDRAGVDHRDIKPANLGVREGRSDRAKHLVLFDFSLSRAGATARDGRHAALPRPVPRRPGTRAVRLGRRAVFRRRGAVRDGDRSGPGVRRRAVRSRRRSATKRPSRPAHVRPGRRRTARRVLPHRAGPQRQGTARHGRGHVGRLAVGVRPGTQDHPRRRRRDAPPPRSRRPRWPMPGCPPVRCPRWNPTAWSPSAIWSLSTRYGFLTTELLCQPDEKSFRPSDVAESIRVLVLHHFADELRAVLLKPSERIVEVVHGEHDAQVAQRVHRGGPVIGDHRRREKSRQTRAGSGRRG